MEVDSVQEATEFIGMSYRVITKIQKKKERKKENRKKGII